MNFLALVAPHPTGRLSAEAQSVLDERADPALARALAAEPIPGEVWDEWLGLLRYTAFSDGALPMTRGLLEWLRAVDTVLHGPAATPERFLGGLAMLTELLGRGLPDAPRALAQWIMAAGHGIRRDHGGVVAPEPHITWASLEPSVCEGAVDQLLLAVGRSAPEASIVVDAMLTNLPVSTPGLRDLWRTWLYQGEGWQEGLDDAAVPHGWRRLAARFAERIELAFLARPDWTAADLDILFRTPGWSVWAGWAELIPQDVPQIERVLATVRRGLAAETQPAADWPVWDHLADRRGHIWPVFEPLVVESLTAIQPSLRQWGKDHPARLLRWLAIPGLIERLERPLLLQLIQHDHPDVRRLVVTTLALRDGVAQA